LEGVYHYPGLVGLLVVASRIEERHVGRVTKVSGHGDVAFILKIWSELWRTYGSDVGECCHVNGVDEGCRGKIRAVVDHEGVPYLEQSIIGIENGGACGGNNQNNSS